MNEIERVRQPLLFSINKHCKVKWKVKHQQQLNKDPSALKAVVVAVASATEVAEEAEVVTVVVAEVVVASVADPAALARTSGSPRPSLVVSSSTDTSTPSS